VVGRSDRACNEPGTHADENEAVRKWKTKSGGQRGILSVGKKTCRVNEAGRKKREMDTENYEPTEGCLLSPYEAVFVLIFYIIFVLIFNPFILC